MEKITEEFDWDKQHSQTIYNWDEILNGDTNQLKRGVDFQVTVGSFIRQARAISRRRSLGFQYKKLGEDTVVLRAYKYEKGEEPREGKEDPAYGDFLNHCLENYGNVVSGTSLNKEMGISWDRATKMIRAGQESGFIGKKINAEGHAKGFRIFGDKLEEITGIKPPKAKSAVAKPLGVTHGQIANVKGGVYVN